MNFLIKKQTFQHVFSLKMSVFVTSEGQKYDYFCDYFCYVLRNTKQVNFFNIKIYGNYYVLIGSKFLRNKRFDSVFNQIFDYVHITHCLIDLPLW